MTSRRDSRSKRRTRKHAASSAPPRSSAEMNSSGAMIVWNKRSHMRSAGEPAFIPHSCCSTDDRRWHQPLEMTAVNNALVKTLGISAATAALALFAYAAQAQAPKPKQPAKKPPACNSLKDET